MYAQLIITRMKPTKGKKKKNGKRRRRRGWKMRKEPTTLMNIWWIRFSFILINWDEDVKVIGKNHKVGGGENSNFSYAIVYSTTMRSTQNRDKSRERTTKALRNWSHIAPQVFRLVTLIRYLNEQAVPFFFFSWRRKTIPPINPCSLTPLLFHVEEDTSKPTVIIYFRWPPMINFDDFLLGRRGVGRESG